MTTVVFVVPGVPVPKGRARACVRNGHVAHYTPEKTARFENLVKMAAMGATQEPFTGPVALTCAFVLPVPASYSKKRRDACLNGYEWPSKKPDTDNLLKAVLDGCNGVVWNDDCQVVQFHNVTKVYGAVPMTTVRVQRVSTMLALPLRGDVS